MMTMTKRSNNSESLTYDIIHTRVLIIIIPPSVEEPPKIIIHFGMVAGQRIVNDKYPNEWRERKKTEAFSIHSFPFL